MSRKLKCFEKNKRSIFDTKTKLKICIHNISSWSRRSNGTASSSPSELEKWREQQTKELKTGAQPESVDQVDQGSGSPVWKQNLEPEQNPEESSEFPNLQAELWHKNISARSSTWIYQKIVLWEEKRSRSRFRPWPHWWCITWGTHLWPTTESNRHEEPDSCDCFQLKFTTFIICLSETDVISHRLQSTSEFTTRIYICVIVNYEY